MAKRPEGVDRAQWQAERAAVWARRNRMLNMAMLIAIAAVVLRYFACANA
jgi:hypothetical protein